MSQFLVFAGAAYDSEWGWDTFVATFPTFNEAAAFCDLEQVESDRWQQIVDVETLTGLWRREWYPDRDYTSPAWGDWQEFET